jgi:hypothetical protein
MSFVGLIRGFSPHTSPGHGVLSFSVHPPRGSEAECRRLEIGSIVMTRGRAAGGFRNDPAASLAVNRPPAWPSLHLPGRFCADERRVSLSAGHRSNPESKVTSEYECASAKAAK